MTRQLELTRTDADYLIELLEKHGIGVMGEQLLRDIERMFGYKRAARAPPRPDEEALNAVPDLRGKHALVLYFKDDADRDEFVALMLEAKPDMRTVKL